MTAPREATQMDSISIHAAGHFVAHREGKPMVEGPICLRVENLVTLRLEKAAMRIQPTPPPPPPVRIWEIQIPEGGTLNWINKDGKSEHLPGPLSCSIHPRGPMTISSPDHH